MYCLYHLRNLGHFPPTFTNIEPVLSFNSTLSNSACFFFLGQCDYLELKFYITLVNTNMHNYVVNHIKIVFDGNLGKILHGERKVITEYQKSLAPFDTHALIILVSDNASGN